MKHYYLLLDVGGTEIKLNALTQDKALLLEHHVHFPSLSDQSSEVILDHFRSIILDFIHRFKYDYHFSGIGLAFPGPFDYLNGISLMTGLRKYEAIYNVNLHRRIESWLFDESYKNIPIIFENDATCFALGEYHQTPDINRGMYITLGTGCGSSFIADNQVVTSGFGLNSTGMIFDVPFRNGIIDEHLSINGLKKIALDKNYPFTNGKALANKAFSGDTLARDVFSTFGICVGEGLASFIAEFQPDEVVFGGQISQSLDLFKHSMLKEWGTTYPVVRRSLDTTAATLYGLYHIIKKATKGDSL